LLIHPAVTFRRVMARKLASASRGVRPFEGQPNLG
jgi:hypothetical protein